HGVNVFNGGTIDAWKQGVIEPLKIKTQAIRSASEVVELILRIDDVIAGSKNNKTPQMPHGGIPDMGEY
ncbi:MAG: TCP-1/cpn60 chaperonin family protein, partial [Nanoarchaeota archaeon]